MWRTTAVKALNVHFDMVDGPMPRGVLGLGDANVHLIDGRWVLLLGGFSTNFRNRLYRATLVDETTGPSGLWRLDQDRRGRALPLVPDPPWGAWDAGGMHTPSYVPAAGGIGPRIYYAGRTTTRYNGPGSAYAIGVLEQHKGSWHRRDAPVMIGRAPRSSVLEPRAIHTDGRYRLWFQAAPHEIGPGEQPDYELHCSDSADGLDDWTRPTTFANRSEGFFDNAVAFDGEQWVMLLARGTNLHATTGFPAQGIWWTTAAQPSADRRDWGPLQRLLDTDVAGVPAWMGHGTCGLGLAFPGDRATVLFTGTRSGPRWPRLALQRLIQLRRPPVPAPFHLAVASVELDVNVFST